MKALPRSRLIVPKSETLSVTPDRPKMEQALADARDDENVSVIILTGQGKDAFCSGGDQKG